MRGQKFSIAGNIENYFNSDSSLYNPDEDPVELCRLAAEYYNSTEECKKDERKAIKLYRKVASCYQYVPSYNCLGRIYMKRREYNMAAKWYRKSAV